MRTVDLNHVREEVIALVERCIPVSLEEFRDVPLNSYERDYLLPYVSDECLTYITSKALANAQPRLRGTYDAVLTERLVPEILKRLQHVRV